MVAAPPTILGLTVGQRTSPTAASTLAYADDDARATHLALTALAAPEDLRLVADFDEESRALAGELPAALPPTLAGLTQAVAELAQRAAAHHAAGRPVLLVASVFAPGRMADGRAEVALLDRWVGAGELTGLVEQVGADRVVLVADVDHALRLFYPLSPSGRGAQDGEARWLTSEGLIADSTSRKGWQLVVETRLRGSQPALRGSALALRTRSCLLGLGDLDGDRLLLPGELSRCVNALDDAEESLPLSIPAAGDAPLFGLVGRPGFELRPPYGAPSFVVKEPGGLLLAAGRLEPATTRPLLMPPGLAVAAEAASTDAPWLGPPTGPKQKEVADPPGDLWGMTAAEERELDARLRWAGAQGMAASATENTLWLAGGVAVGAIGLSLLVAEVALNGLAVFQPTVGGISPVLLAAGVALAFGAAVCAASFLAPVLGGGESPTLKAPAPGRGRRRAIAAALDTLEADAASDLTWRYVGAAAGAAAGAASLVAAGTLVAFLVLGPLADDNEDMRRVLAIGAGGAAGLGVALFAVSAILPLGKGHAARVLDAVQGENVLEESRSAE